MREAWISDACAGGGGALSQAAIEERRQKAQQVHPPELYRFCSFKA
jgi:hypothetical protein